MPKCKRFESQIIILKRLFSNAHTKYLVQGSKSYVRERGLTVQKKKHEFIFFYLLSTNYLERHIFNKRSYQEVSKPRLQVSTNIGFSMKFIYKRK